MESFLTLVIAVGGIATGIGAIWTAMLARRQLNEQRHFLKEQNEIARSQAQLTERNLTEQNERAREENERARLSFEVDMMLKLEDHWHSPTVLARRSKAAKYVKAHFFTDDGGLLEVQRIDEDTRVDTLYMLNFFERLGALVSQGVVRAETAWHRFGVYVRPYWALYRPTIEKTREEQKDPTLTEDFERLDALMADLDRQHGVGDEYITEQQLRLFVEAESKVFATEEAPTREEE